MQGQQTDETQQLEDNPMVLKEGTLRGMTVFLVMKLKEGSMKNDA